MDSEWTELPSRALRGAVAVRSDHDARDVASHVAAQVSVADVRGDGRLVALDRVAEAVALEL